MDIEIDLEDAHEKAREIVKLLKNVAHQCRAAKADVLINRYDSVVSIPNAVIQFSTRSTQLNGQGYTAEVLGPIIADIYRYPDWAAAEPAYNAIKLALTELVSWIMQNGTLFKHTFNADGFRQYDQPLSTEHNTALLGKLDAVLPLFKFKVPS